MVKMLLRCRATVFSLMNSSTAMSRLLRPSATSRITSVSRAVSGPASGEWPASFWERAVAGDPVIVIAGIHGELRAATPAAVMWLAEVEDTTPGGFAMTLHYVVAQAHVPVSGTARARMRDAGGNWVVLQASRLIAGDDPEQMVVTVEPATSHDVVSLLLAAYGVSARERDVCLEILSGNPTAEIARNLFISPHTVHDHLKALYGKLGVGSRGELVAKLLV